MRRREFIKALGSAAAAAWPISARGQQPAVPVIGFLGAASSASYATFVNGFHAGLKEQGFVAPDNVGIEYRWADGNYGRLPGLASELASRRVSVLVATGGLQSSLAAKNATDTIPIVFTLGSDPVKFGVVSSLNRPDRNITGVALLAYALDAKRVELLHEIVPNASAVALLVNPHSPAQAEAQYLEVEAAARNFSRHCFLVRASTPDEIDLALATVAKQKGAVLLVSADPLFLSRRDQLVSLAARHTIPAIYEWRQLAEAGGLMSYGIKLVDAFRQAGVYAGKILRGAKPADLPVLQPTKFELVINAKTAKVLGIEIPPTLLARADEVIE
jgi:putative tryptophan/tyrosine transport system substrate-binding protein